MKRKNSNNTWLYTICIVLIAIVFGFLSFIPVNIECIKPFIAYFDPTKLLSNLPLWIFTNYIISLYSHSEKTSILNTTLFSIVCFVSYSLFSMILTHTIPKDMFLTWILFILIWTIFSYLVWSVVWSANRQDTKGWILSTILLAILFSTCFTYTDNTLSSTTILNFLLYVFLVVVLYKGTKETLIIVILSIILALILSKTKIQIIFTKSACIYFNSVIL